MTIKITTFTVPANGSVEIPVYARQINFLNVSLNDGLTFARNGIDPQEVIQQTKLDLEGYKTLLFQNSTGTNATIKAVFSDGEFTDNRFTGSNLELNPGQTGNYGNQAVTGAAVKLFDANPDVKERSIQNLGSGKLFWGYSNAVTALTGSQVPVNGFLNLTSGAEVWVISDSSSDVRWTEHQ